MIETTPLPPAELELFKQLKRLNVIFDVGARVDVDYIELWPKSQHHLFEPVPEFVADLEIKVGGRENVWINAYGLGDINEERGYKDALQAFVGSGSCPLDADVDRVFSIKTLDGYVKEHAVKKIDFLKIDTEGHDEKVISGGLKTLGKIRFIQYEHWGQPNKEAINQLLHGFEIYDVGYRNVFCMNKKLVSEAERARLSTYILDNKLCELA